MTVVEHDGVAVRIDGQRRLLLSGAIHYPRSTPRMWPDLVQRSRDAGLSAIETYVFWNLHEHTRGRYDFSDRLDLRRFLDVCAEAGMHVVLRIGPYICAETNFGGFPPWLPAAGCRASRVDDPVFMREVLRWLRVLMGVVGDLQATRGGPVILAQLENEYANVAQRHGDRAARYLEWVAQLGPEIGLEVPLLMCEGAAGDAIPTINGFDVADRAAQHRVARPDVPVLWTECWTGWYDIVGGPRHTRDPAELADAVVRFLAAGGTGVNYYMWHGGTDFGRQAMYAGPTSYDYGAPLDEYGLPTPTSRHLARLHSVLRAHEDVLLDGSGPRTLRDETNADGLRRIVAWGGGSDDGALLAALNRSSSPWPAFEGLAPVAPWSSILVDRATGDLRLLFASAEVMASGEGTDEDRWLPGPPLAPFETVCEPIGREAPDVRPAVALEMPAGMLEQTRDRTDYAWYETTVERSSAGPCHLVLEEVRDLAAVYVDGALVARGPDRLVEDRPDHWRHEHEIDLPAGTSRLSILVAAWGLAKGDWMIGTDLMHERKGLCGAVRLDGVEVRGWTLTAGLRGEMLRRFDPAVDGSCDWRPASAVDPRPLRWHRTRFGGVPDSAAAVAVEVGDLFKGMLWVNGHCLGRHWQVPAERGDEPAWQYVIRTHGHGHPTQTRYHLPLDWLRVDENTLVVFEETAAAPTGARIVIRSR